MKYRATIVTTPIALSTALVAGPVAAAKVTGPVLGTTPQGHTAVLQATTMIAPTITSLSQHPWTDHGGGVTALDVNGTGNCNFTVSGAGMTANFSSSKATPFPMTITIKNAPIGNYQWTATGTGTCTGTANASTHVES